MPKKTKIKLLGLSYSNSQVGSYVVVLSETKGDRKLPIIIKPNDAEFIALKIEDIKSARPLIHDVVKNMSESFGIELQEVYIKEVIEGIFYPKLIFTNAVEESEIDCSIGDAISLSMVYKCPIYASDSVMKTASIYMTNDGQITEEQNELNHSEKPIAGNSVENLEKMLQKAIENEEYEVAAQLRNRIENLKNS